MSLENFEKDMERIVKISRSFQEAEKWEIEQEKAMTSEERQTISRILKEKYYGKNPKDVRESQLRNES